MLRQSGGTVNKFAFSDILFSYLEDASLRGKVYWKYNLFNIFIGCDVLFFLFYPVQFYYILFFFVLFLLHRKQCLKYWIFHHFDLINCDRICLSLYRITFIIAFFFTKKIISKFSYFEYTISLLFLSLYFISFHYLLFCFISFYFISFHFIRTSKILCFVLSDKSSWKFILNCHRLFKQAERSV